MIAFPTEPGIYFGIPNDVYHADRNWLSSTNAKLLFSKSPQHLYHALNTPHNEDEGKTPSMLLGSVTHGLILEPNTHPYVCLEKWDMRTTAGKAARAQWEQENAGKMGVDQATWGHAVGMHASAMACTSFTGFLNRCTTEVVFLGIVNGVKMKCKVDMWDPDLYAVGDLKTTSDASKKAFAYSAGKLGYIISAAHYRLTIAAALGLSEYPSFTLFPLENTPPYAMGTPLYFDERQLERAHVALLDKLLDYSLCMESNYWGGYPQEPEELSIPPYMLGF
jgi:hypothetical protein